MNPQSQNTVQSGMKKTLILVLGLLVFGLFIALPAVAQQAEEPEHVPTTPAQRAAESDYVVLAQLDVYKYEEKHKIPVRGETWFDVLLSYKAPERADRLLVFEEGVGHHLCYFKDAPLYGELSRFLLFLIKDPESSTGRLRGHPDGCALPVLTDSNNQYVVRWPTEGFPLDEAGEALVQEFEFQGPGSIVNLSAHLGFRIREIAEEQKLEHIPDDRRNRHALYRYTRGIPLSDYRIHIIGPENLRTP